jgi:hypothetical protein
MPIFSGKSYLPVFCIFLGLLACTDETIPYSVNDSELNLDTLRVDAIWGFAYQVPPQAGALPRLYLETTGEYQTPLILVGIASQTPEAQPTTLVSLIDSAVFLDSAIFQMTLDQDTIPTDIDFGLYYFPEGGPVQGDSVFNEAGSHYNNLTEADLMAAAYLVDQQPLTRKELDTTGTAITQLIYHLSTTVLDSFIDTSGINANRTFMVKPMDNLPERVAFYSRESGNGPRLTIYYRQVKTTSDTTIVDTLEATFYTTKDLALINPGELTTADTTLLSVGRARGLRSVVQFEWNRDWLPEQAVLKTAELHLFTPEDNLEKTFKVLGYPITDSLSIQSFQILDTDSYSINTGYPLSANVNGNRLILEIRSYLQSVQFQRLTNYGIKLFSSTGNDPFQVVHFYTDVQDSLSPYLTIQYVAPE